jgi:hypothetical protein
LFFIYIQDVGIPAKGLRPKRRCFAKKSLKDSNADFSPEGLAAVKGWRKIMMEFILVLGFKYRLCVYFASENEVFMVFSPPGSNDTRPWSTGIK